MINFKSVLYQLNTTKPALAKSVLQNPAPAGSLVYFVLWTFTSRIEKNNNSSTCKLFYTVGLLRNSVIDENNFL
jgi:hypothetical protein